jgi:hypothetical protein
VYPQNCSLYGCYQSIFETTDPNLRPRGISTITDPTDPHSNSTVVYTLFNGSIAVHNLDEGHIRIITPNRRALFPDPLPVDDDNYYYLPVLGQPTGIIAIDNQTFIVADTGNNRIVLVQPGYAGQWCVQTLAADLIGPMWMMRTSVINSLDFFVVSNGGARLDRYDLAPMVPMFGSMMNAHTVLQLHRDGLLPEDIEDLREILDEEKEEHGDAANHDFVEYLLKNYPVSQEVRDQTRRNVQHRLNKYNNVFGEAELSPHRAKKLERVINLSLAKAA